MGWRPKWDKEREVPLTGEGVSVLMSLERPSPIFGRAGAGGPLVPAAFVFVKTGRHEGRAIWTRIDCLTKGWKKALQAAGLENYGYVFKDIRNTTSTLLTQRYGFTAKEESEVLGHSERVARKHYTAVQREQVRNRMSRMPSFRPGPTPLRLVESG